MQYKPQVNKLQQTTSIISGIPDFPISDTIQQTLLNEIPENILNTKVFPSTVIYMTYWYYRFEKQDKKQKQQKQLLIEYFQNGEINNAEGIVETILSNQEFQKLCEDFTLNILPKRKTVDLFITRGEKIVDGDGSLEFITIRRNNYPGGNALPGGIILESDENNEKEFPTEIYASLRIGAKKVLGIDEQSTIFDESDDYYYVHHMDGGASGLRIKKNNIIGYHYEDSLSSIIAPSDPRHLVNTTGFKVEYYENDENQATLTNTVTFTKGSDIKNIGQEELIFPHHRKLLWGLYAKTPSILQNEINHNDFIKEILSSPEKMYEKLIKRFKENNFGSDTLVPEFLPVVKYLEDELFSKRINKLCESNTALIGMRDTIFQNLQHLHQSNRKVCPYLATIIGIEKAVEFFDVIVREEIGFYNSSSNDSNSPIVHDPANRPHAKYHTYKYNYRFLDYLHNDEYKEEIIIPSFLHVGATDLMKIRGVPLRIIGISTKLLFVDEFEQTPLEFWDHDQNHNRRYALEDRKIANSMGIPLKELYNQSSQFAKEYMSKIIINKNDSPEQKEIKKLKKIILFEIIHEDARVFLKDTITKTLLRVEGEDVPFEWQSYNEDAKESTVVDIQEAYIHTLAYVRYKLQKGFYDTIDDQKSYIVGNDYRTSRKIAEVAYEMLEELGCNPPEGIPTDEKGNVSIDWLMQRVWSYGPPEIHNEEFSDPDKEKYYTPHIAATTREYNV